MHQSMYIIGTSYDDSSKMQTYRHKPIRFLMLFLMCFIILGVQYSFNIPQALQESLETSLGISETQFNLFYSVVAAASIVTALMFGIMIDYIGVCTMLIILAVLTALFQFIIALGGYLNSYAIILTGRILLGLVCQSLVSVQLTMVSNWFKGKELAFAIGIALTSPELGSALNSIVTPKIQQVTGSIGTAILVSALFCTLGAFAAIGAAYLDKKADEIDQSNALCQGQLVFEGQEQLTEQSIKCGDIWYFKFSFWLILFICMLALGSYIPSLDNANRLLQKRFCFTQVEAGQVIMATYCVAALFSPLLGLAVDKIGERRRFIFATSLIFVAAHTIILVWPQCEANNSQYGILLGYILLGFGYCFYSNSLASSLPLLVKKQYTGTAFGLLVMFQNAALAIFPLISGALIGSSTQPEVGYRKSQAFFLSMSLLCFFSCFGLLFISNHCKKKLKASKIELLVNILIRNGNIIAITSSQAEDNVSVTSDSELNMGLLQRSGSMKSLELMLHNGSINQG